VGNQSQQFAQVVLDVPISPLDDLEQASAEIAAAAAELYADRQWNHVFLAEPEVLGVESITREETVLRVAARVRPLEQWRVARELRARILQRFARARLASKLPDDTE
jgi:small conductance mechanosensitive channel